jgi:hypothetical protein
MRRISEINAIREQGGNRVFNGGRAKSALPEA